jgi:hypothetical protein
VQKVSIDGGDQCMPSLEKKNKKKKQKHLAKIGKT